MIFTIAQCIAMDTFGMLVERALNKPLLAQKFWGAVWAGAFLGLAIVIGGMS